MSFHSCIILKSVSLKFIELCREMPCLRPSEGHQHGGRIIAETSIIEFCYWNRTTLSGLTLQTIKFLEALISHGTKTSEELVIFNFGKWRWNMKTGNRNYHLLPDQCQLLYLIFAWFFQKLCISVRYTQKHPVCLLLGQLIVNQSPNMG